MRTKRFFGLVAVLALLALASLAGLTPAARAASNSVFCPASPCPASAIQAAIEAASDGDTIFTSRARIPAVSSSTRASRW